MLLRWRAYFNVWFTARRAPAPDPVQHMWAALAEVEHAAAGDAAEAARRLATISAAGLSLLPPLERAKLQATLDDAIAALGPND